MKITIELDNPAELKELFGARRATQIIGKQPIGSRKNKAWTEEEIQVVKTSDAPAKKLARQLGRTPNAIHTKRWHIARD